MVAFKIECFAKKEINLLHKPLAIICYLGGGHFVNGDHFEFKAFKNKLLDQNLWDMIYSLVCRPFLGSASPLFLGCLKSKDKLLFNNIVTEHHVATKRVYIFVAYMQHICVRNLETYLKNNYKFIFSFLPYLKINMMHWYHALKPIKCTALLAN